MEDHAASARTARLTELGSHVQRLAPIACLLMRIVVALSLTTIAVLVPVLNPAIHSIVVVVLVLLGISLWLLLRIVERLIEAIGVALPIIADRPSEPSGRPLGNAAADEWTPLATVREQLARAQQQDDWQRALELRRELVARSPSERSDIDRGFTEWFTASVGRALRDGRAVDVLPAVDQCLADLGQHPGLEPIVESLPLLRASVANMRSATDDEEGDDQSDGEMDDPTPWFDSTNGR